MERGWLSYSSSSAPPIDADIIIGRGLLHMLGVNCEGHVIFAVTSF